MYEIKTKIKLWNVLDELKIRNGEVIPQEYDALVDTGAVRMVLPEKIANELKLMRSERKVSVKYGNGEIAEKEVGIGLRVEIMNRECETSAIIEPNLDKILVGLIVIEELDLHIDTTNKKLIPNPDSPDRLIYKVY